MRTLVRCITAGIGYAATTVAGVAAAVGVSVETTYKTFRGKPGLIGAIQHSGLAGAGSVPAPDRSDEMSAQDLPAQAVLTSWTTLTKEVMPQVARRDVRIHRTGALRNPGRASTLADRRLRRLHLPRPRSRTPRRIRSVATQAPPGCPGRLPSVEVGISLTFQPARASVPFLLRRAVGSVRRRLRVRRRRPCPGGCGPG